MLSYTTMSCLGFSFSIPWSVPLPHSTTYRLSLLKCPTSPRLRVSSSRPLWHARAEASYGCPTGGGVNDYTFFATCPRGLGEYLADEIESPNVKGSVLDVVSSGVRFRSTTFETGMRACLWLRTAIRVLHQIAHSDFAVHSKSRSDCVDGDDVYRFVRESVDWVVMLVNGALSFSIKARLSQGQNMRMARSRQEYGQFQGCRYREFPLSEPLVQVRAKDAICDALRDAGFDKPPKPKAHASADMPIFLIVHGCSITIYRDMAGASLHKRGYKDSIPIHKSSLNECVAAGMSYIAGIKPNGKFEEGVQHSSLIDSTDELTIIDPMCGSATILIEAALCIKQVAVGLLRREFPFQKWGDFDAQLFGKLVAEAQDIARKCRDRPVNLIGNDVNGRAISLARRGIRDAGLVDDIQIFNKDLRNFAVSRAPRLVISNPPWGMRLGEEKEAWSNMGDFLRQFCAGSTAVLLSGDSSLTRGLRMRARRKHPVRIGNVETRVLLYDVLTYEQVKNMNAKRVHLNTKDTGEANCNTACNTKSAGSASCPAVDSL